MENHEKVVRIAQQLRERGLRVWLDEDQMRLDIVQRMTEGIDQSQAVVIFVTRAYIDKVAGEEVDNCKREFTYAVRRKGTKKILSVVMEEGVKDQRTWNGPVGADLGSHFFVSCNVDEIVSGLEKIGVSIDHGARGDDRDTSGSHGSESVA